MMELVEANWPLFLIALVIGLVIAWWIFVALRKTSVNTDTSDVLDEGTGPANRNQALIDAPPASQAPVVAPPVSGIGGANTGAAEKIVPRTEPAEDTAGADNLSRIKGVGPKLKALLISQGITRFEQIANWSDAEIDRVDAQLGRFEGRIRRDNWVEQARLLADGNDAGYEAKFGKL